jgi:hypothetical protein
MDDRPAIPASEKTETGFNRLVLRRLINCGTPTTAKKYDQIWRVHSFCGRLHREKQDEDCSGSGERRTGRQQVILPIEIELRHNAAATARSAKQDKGRQREQ